MNDRDDIYLKVFVAKLKRRKEQLEAELQHFIDSRTLEERKICGKLEEIESLLIWIQGK